MSQFLTWGAVFGLGFGYFVGAVPAGVAMGIPLPLTGLLTWLGYTVGAAMVVLPGEPFRVWLLKRLNLERRLHSNESWLGKKIERYGLPALGLLAPVTIGPQIGGLLGIGLGMGRGRLLVALSAGLLPWLFLFLLAAFLGLDWFSRPE
jgi:hypothetical protein